MSTRSCLVPALCLSAAPDRPFGFIFQNDAGIGERIADAVRFGEILGRPCRRPVSNHRVDSGIVERVAAGATPPEPILWKPLQQPKQFSRRDDRVSRR